MEQSRMVQHSGHHKTSEVFELLEVVQFRCPYTSMKYPQLLSNLRVESKIEEILRNSAISEFGSVYYFSERDATRTAHTIERVRERRVKRIVPSYAEMGLEI